MKVLFIDDDEASVLPAIDKFRSESLLCEYTEFEDAHRRIEDFKPDIVILDLMAGGATGDPTGNAGKLSYDDIWERRFCPVVFYSGNPDLADDFDQGKVKHPLISKVKKGKDSEDHLYKKMQEFNGLVTSFIAIKESVDIVMQQVLRDLAPLVFGDTINTSAEQNEVLQYLGQRRVAVLMDDGMLFEQPIPSWGQYVWPPMHDYPKLGDVLFKIGEDETSPESFRVTLTPSCDLVRVGTRQPKVDEVLCACCEPVASLLSDVDFTRAKDKKRYIRKILTQGYAREFIPLPCLPNVIPLMVANAKKLELIKHDAIGNEAGDNIEYIRMASIDSPFKELIAEAYVNTAGRAGVPDRDYITWTTQIWDEVK